MSFADINIKKSYKTNSSNIVKDFYLPVLSESVLYKRAVGFFTSGALLEISKGISGLIKKDGKMRFIVSPKLTEEDIQAIQKGYDDREIVTKALDREFIEPQNDSDKALFLLAVINFAFYGKQPNQELSLEKNLKKNVIAKPGASLGFSNYLHSFGLVENVVTSVYYNLLSEQNVKSYTWLSEGVGKPFWEMMPTTENDCVTETSKKTLLGHLVPLSRYVLMVDKGLYFTEGVIYHLAKSEKKKGQSVENWIEASMSWYLEKDEIKALNADISKKPWRMLTSMLSLSDTERKYCNLGLSLFINRISEYDKVFSIWSGGIDVSGDSFGKKIKNNDDYVESEIQLHSSAFGDSFCNKLFEEMRKLNEFCFDLQKFVVGYNAEIRGGSSSKNARQIGSQNIPSVESDYWQQCESIFQRIVDTCSIENTDQYNHEMDKINDQIWQFVKQIYNQYCPNQSVRQLEAWAKNFPKKFEKKRLS